MYTEELSAGSIIPFGTGVLAADVLTAAAVHGEYVFLKRARVRRILALVSTTVANDTAAAVVTFRHRITPGSATGETSIGTLTFPDGVVAGKVLYKDIEEEEFAAGDSIAFEVTTAGTDGTAAAGGAYYGFECFLDNEDPRNETDMVLSV